jgi:hypothetical protein
MLRTESSKDVWRTHRLTGRYTLHTSTIMHEGQKYRFWVRKSKHIVMLPLTYIITFSINSQENEPTC